MTVQILLPKIGMSMNEGVLTEWLAPDGATVVEGQPLYSVESDKSTTEIESPASGVLQILQPVGGTHEVGTLIGEIS